MSMNRLAWLDLETTGLEPKVHRILEVGIIVTDDQLNEIARKSWVISHGIDAYRTADAYVRNMHTTNGLWAECELSDKTLMEAAREAIGFLAGHGVHGSKAPLCGSSIGFDRSFLKEQAPALESFFHYRNIDVSSLGELAARWYPDAHAARPAPPAPPAAIHRALPDIAHSIATLAYYRRTVLA